MPPINPQECCAQPILVATPADQEAADALRVYDALARISIADKSLGFLPLMVKLREITLQHISFEVSQ